MTDYRKLADTILHLRSWGGLKDVDAMTMDEWKAVDTALRLCADRSAPASSSLALTISGSMALAAEIEAELNQPTAGAEGVWYCVADDKPCPTAEGCSAGQCGKYGQPAVEKVRRLARLAHRAAEVLKSAATPAATETTHSETPRTLALNLRCGQDGLSWDQSGPKFHALAEQLERELAEYKSRAELAEIAQVKASMREPDNVGDSDRWEDPRDLIGGETDCAPSATTRSQIAPFEAMIHDWEAHERRIDSGHAAMQMRELIRVISSTSPTTAMPNDDRRVHLACEIANRIGMMIPYEGTKMQKVDHAGWKKLQAVATELVKLLLAEHPSASSATPRAEFSAPKDSSK